MMTIVEDTRENTAEGTERGLFRPDQSGYPVGWYAVALSDSLKSCEVRALDLCDGHLVMYRGEDEVVRVMTPYCPHMGADLGLGSVQGSDLQCPFHHWRFDPDGRCSHIPTGDRITRAMRVFKFPVQERWGLIWVFWGEEPTYEIPVIPGWEEGAWISRAVEMPMNQKFAKDPWVFTTNVFDFSHFNVVHGIAGLTADTDVQWHDNGASYEFSMEHELIGAKRTRTTLWGTNVVVTDNHRGDERMSHMTIGTPLGPEIGTKYFGVFATPASDHAEQTLDQLITYLAQIINDDLAVLGSIEFGHDHLGASDRHMIKYLRWYHAYPKRTINDFKVRPEKSEQPVGLRR